jgi:excisionase family DNA binding protein
MKLLSIKEACDRLSIGRTSLYALIAAGDIVTRKIGRRTLINEETLESFVRSAEKGGPRHTPAASRFEGTVSSDDDGLGDTVTKLRKARCHGNN